MKNFFGMIITFIMVAVLLSPSLWFIIEGYPVLGGMIFFAEMSGGFFFLLAFGDK